MVQSYEPGVLKYQVFAALDGTIVTQEICVLLCQPITSHLRFPIANGAHVDSNYDAALSHLNSSHLSTFLEKCSDEHLLQKEIETQVLQPFAGFELRAELMET